MEVLLLGGGIFFSQPGGNLLAPGWPVLVNAELLGHRVTRFSERGSGSFVFDLNQWSQIASDGEDDGSGLREAGESVVLAAQERS